MLVPRGKNLSYKIKGRHFFDKIILWHKHRLLLSKPFFSKSLKSWCSIISNFPDFSSSLIQTKMTGDNLLKIEFLYLKCRVQKFLGFIICPRSKTERFSDFSILGVIYFTVFSKKIRLQLLNINIISCFPPLWIERNYFYIH